MGRAEAFALANSPVDSFWDGISNGIGYALVLIIIGSIREIMGSGSILGYKIVPTFMYNLGYIDNGLMLFPPAAFILLGTLIFCLKTVGGATGEEE
jgi:Na+-transporting NADH:ubiquinone oxidoreductase subunit D